MIAFLKRRWLLLSCVVVLMIFSVIDLMLVSGQPNAGMPVNLEVGVYRGNFGAYRNAKQGAEFLRLEMEFHPPEVGGLPVCNMEGDVWIAMPIWILLPVVVIAILIRERKWREERAREAEPS